MKVVVSDYTFEDLKAEREALAGLAELDARRDWEGSAAFLQRARDADGVLSQMSPLDREVIEGLERCRVIVRYGVGVDNIDLGSATRRGIAICNVPDYCTEDVADHTMALALAALRRLPRATAYLRSGGWSQEPLRPIRRLSSLVFGLYGFGRIARAVARRSQAFGFRVVAADPFVAPDVFQAAGVEQVTPDTLLMRSDVLSLHMPLQEGTRHLIGDEALARMKEGALLVNCARGALVDTAALLRALDAGRLRGAALDVLETEPIPSEHPVLHREDVIVTGHLAWYSEEALTQLQRSVGEECARVLRGEPPRSVVNPAYREHVRG